MAGKKILNRYKMEEHKELEEYLNQMSREGYNLEYINSSNIKFEESGLRKKYCVDIVNEKSIFSRKNGVASTRAKEKFKNAGYDFIAQIDGMQIFSATKKSKEISSFQSDEEKVRVITATSIQTIIVNVITLFLLMIMSLMSRENAQLEALDISILAAFILYRVSEVFIILKWKKDKINQFKINQNIEFKRDKYVKIRHLFNIIDFLVIIGLLFYIILGAFLLF